MKKDSYTQEPEHPYLNNQKGYLDRLDAERANTATWKHIAWFSNLITLGAVAGAIYLGSLPDIVPFIFKQDASGGIVALGIANQQMKVNNVMIASQVKDFVIALEQVPLSSDIKSEYVQRISNMSTSKTFAEVLAPILKQRYKEAGVNEVVINVNSVLPIQKNSWQVDWSEMTNKQPSGSYKAILTIDQLPMDYKQSSEQMLYNPLRIVVTDININKTAEIAQ